VFVQDHAHALLGIARLHQELLTTLGNFIKPFQMICRFSHKSGLVILLFRFDLICMHGNFSNAYKDSLYLEQCLSRIANHLWAFPGDSMVCKTSEFVPCELIGLTHTSFSCPEGCISFSDDKHNVDQVFVRDSLFLMVTNNFPKLQWLSPNDFVSMSCGDGPCCSTCPVTHLKTISLFPWSQISWSMLLWWWISI
jgi:hypothetical protein